MGEVPLYRCMLPERGAGKPATHALPLLCEKTHVGPRELCDSRAYRGTSLIRNT